MADTTTNATEQAANYTLDITRQEFTGVTFAQGNEENGRSPNDLVGQLPSGEQFVLADYLVLVKATGGALPPPLTLNDGTVIEGAEVLAALGDVNLDLVGDTAAGGQAGPNATGNASYTSTSRKGWVTICCMARLCLIPPVLCQRVTREACFLVSKPLVPWI